MASGLYDAVINGAAGFNRGLLSGLDVVANPVAGLLNTVSRADGGAGLGIKPNPMQRAGRSLGIGQGGSEGAAFLGSMAGQIPVASDVMGLAQDIEAMRSGEMPVSPLTVGLTGIGLLPFVPSASRFLMDKLPGGHEPRVGDRFGANERGMLGGRNAGTADLDALGSAQTMAASGVPREQIWRQTGWFQAPDGNWKFEIDDSGAGLSDAAWQGAVGGGGRLHRASDAIQHPGLTEAYDLSNTGLLFSDDLGNAQGSYSPGLISLDGAGDNPVSTALHEAQHAVQNIEGFAGGGNPGQFRTTGGQVRALRGIYDDTRNGIDISNRLWNAGATDPNAPGFNEALDAVADAAGMPRERAVQGLVEVLGRTNGVIPNPRASQGFIDSAERAYKAGVVESATGFDALDQYQRLMGETEARAVQARQRLTPEQRQSRPFWDDYDVPEADQTRGLAGGDAYQIGGKRLTKKQADLLPPEQREHWHPIGDGKDAGKPWDEMSRSVTDQTGLQPFRGASPEDMQGGVLIPAFGDRTDIGRDLLAVGDTPLGSPVRLEGGHGYMRQGDESIWASDANPVKGLHNRISPVIESGQTPYLTYMPMAHGPADFTMMMHDAVLEQMKGGSLSKTAKLKFDRALRKRRPEWAGIDSPDSRAQIESNGELRHAFMDVAELDDFQKRGFPNLAETRFAITDPDLMHTPLHRGGQSISVPTGKVVDSPTQPHSTYGTQMAGDYFGGFREGVPREVLFPDFFKHRRDIAAPLGGDNRSFQFSKLASQATDQQWVDGMMRFMESLGGQR